MDQELVHAWYEKDSTLDEMRHFTSGELKIWEERVLDFITKPSKVLDIGCGLGREAFALHQKGYSVTGIDISENAVKNAEQIAKAHKMNIPFLRYNGKTLPFPDHSFDAVIIWSQTFGLLYGDEYKESFLKECKRVLKEGGILSFSAHDREFQKEHYGRFVRGHKFFPYADSEIYWENFLPEEIMTFAEQAGFTVVKCERGEIYKPEDGVVLHCVCKRRA
jgi:ubiquinone/menaquinone biosynthesis C-methylase UbiE